MGTALCLDAEKRDGHCVRRHLQSAPGASSGVRLDPDARCEARASSDAPSLVSGVGCGVLRGCLRSGAARLGCPSGKGAAWQRSRRGAALAQAAGVGRRRVAPR